MRKLFPVIFIFFLLSLFSLKFPFLLPIVFIPLFFIRRKDFTLFFIIFITIGIIRSGFFTFPSFENPKTDTLIGKVVSFERRTSVEIKTEYGRVNVYKNRIYNLRPFDEVEVVGEFINDFGGNPGEESFILYSISKNSVLKFYARDIRVRKRDNGIISRIRNRIYSNLNLLPEKYSFVRGIFMGGGSIEREIKEKFKYAGVMHLLAVSGFHLSI
ncbi:MAG: ComEC/Rec2 family competence protein, partial [Caldisericia bacterium]|nr:ComEC/Rec2 family competence protein [Caldisericia bacterium]